MPNKVELAYIEMAVACIQPEIMKAHVREELKRQCPLSGEQMLHIISIAKKELSAIGYKRRENNILSAIRSQNEQSTANP